MNKEEWTACIDPQPMFKFMRRRASDRKLRLYLCAGCRHIAHLFFRPASAAAIEVAERFADGRATKDELDRAAWAAESATFGYEFDNERFTHRSPLKTEVVPRLVEMGALPQSALSGGEWQVDKAFRQRLLAAANLAEYCASRSPRKFDWGIEYLSGVDWPGRWLLDCIFNPFSAVALSPTGFTPVVVSLAQAAYQERDLPSGHLDPVCLAVLADALEDAGCRDEQILGHLRGPGPHVRGCHVLDLILGRS